MRQNIMEQKNKETIFSKELLYNIIPNLNKDEKPPSCADVNILNEIEILSLKAEKTQRHALSIKNDFQDKTLAKNDIVDLIKSACALPDVDTPEKMLTDYDKKNNDGTNAGKDEKTPYRMINLISKNYKLPDIRNENLK